MTTATIAFPSMTRRRGRHRRPSVAARTAGRVVTTALFAVIALLLAIGYGTIDNRWYKVVSIQGQSMRSAMEPGDLAIFIRPDHVEVGDIAVFQVNGSIVTHRIVDIDADGNYVTQGDANPSPDRWDPNEVDIVGVYLFRIPLLGRLFGLGSSAYLSDQASVPVSLAAAP